MNAEQCHTLFSRLRTQNPDPSTELNYSSPFELLVAVILSARSADKTVNKVTAELFKIANTPQTMLELGREKLNAAIKTIGLYEAKGKSIISTCEILLVKYQGQVPNTREALESLPGVGRKTASVILNTIFGEPTLGIDTHIFRVANRVGLANATTPRQVEKQLIACIPQEFLLNAHHWLVLHGRYVCLARQPKCDKCIIADLCEKFKVNSQKQKQKNPFRPF